MPPNLRGVRVGVSVKVRDVIRRLEADGWQLTATKGSHRQFEHPTKKGKVTVAGKPGDDVPPKTLGRVWQQAELPKL